MPGLVLGIFVLRASAIPNTTRRSDEFPCSHGVPISSSFSLTGYLPLSSSGRLPTLLMRSAKIPQSLAC